MNPKILLTLTVCANLTALSVPCRAAAADDSGAPELPPGSVLNEKAGSGEPILLKLRLGAGEEMPFVVDTGSSVTILDPSLEPLLGARVKTEPLGRPLGGENKREGVYAAPKLLLGGTPLRTGATVLTGEMFPVPACAVKGILGMDCLSNYCVQIDFAARKLRFLGPGNLKREGLGKRYSLSEYYNTPLVDMSLPGGRTVRLMVDSGFYQGVDVTLPRGILKQMLLRQEIAPMCCTLDFGERGSAPVDYGPALALGGQSYKDMLFAEITIHRKVLLGILSVKGGPFHGWMTLKFLARHRVTFDFPNHAMYLLPIQSLPL
jgi:hypothetical protein